MNKISNILERLNKEFPPKENQDICCGIVYINDNYVDNKNDSFKLAIRIWINKKIMDDFCLDDENELDDIDKLVNDIKHLIKEN